MKKSFKSIKRQLHSNAQNINNFMEDRPNPGKAKRLKER